MSVSVLSAADRRRSLAAILASAFAVGLTISMTTPLVSLLLEARGHGGLVIGLVAAAYSVAILAFGPLVPPVMDRLGPVPTLIGGALVAAAAIAAIPHAGALAVIFMLRFMMGAGNAFDWIISETWVNSLPGEADRGMIVAAYTSIWGAGLAGGPILLNVTGTSGAGPFLVAAAFLVAAMVPVVAARRVAPPMAVPRRAGRLRGIARSAPLALGAGFVCGFGEGAFFALFPVHALRHGFDAGGAVLLLSIFAAGGIVLQMPLGWLADRLSRRVLLAGSAATALGCAAAVPWVLAAPAAAWAVLFLWGGAVGGFYTLGLIVLGSRHAGGDLAAANTAFILSYTVGLIAGPAVAGTLMAAWPAHGLPATIAAVYAGFLAAALRAGRDARAGAGDGMA